MKRGFRTKRDAQLFAATVEVSKAKGEYVAPKLGRVSVGELARQLAGTQAAGHRAVALPDAGVGLARSRATALGHGAGRRRGPARRRGVDHRHGRPTVPVPPRCCGHTACCRAFWPTR